MAKNKLTDRELNAKLMESLNITTADAKAAFNDLMKEKVAQIRQEVRQEVFEEFSKQAKIDKQNIVESMNELTNKVINEEKKKNDVHRKSLIKEKLALKEAKDNFEKELTDKTAMIQEDFNKKLRNAVAVMKKSYEEQKQDFIQKATKFVNESVKAEVIELHNDKKELGNALSQFNKFISEQVKKQVQEHRDEMKSVDALRVRLVKESAEKLANDKKQFFMEAASKLEKYTNEAVARELNEFRQDIAESRKKQFGAKLFEAFAREYAIKFFNEDKVVSKMLESVKASQNRLKHTNKVLEQQLNESKSKLNELASVNNKLTREKIINESVAHLAKEKQDMIRNLVKEVQTEKLNESIKRFIPMILGNSSAKSINKSESVLKEGRKSTFLTGENKQNKVAMSFMEKNDSGLSSDLDAEIERAIANSKLN